MKINVETIKKQIIHLFHDLIEEDEIVVGLVRYGAHIPHLYQEACIEKNIKPKKINLLLSHMISFFPEEFYRNKRFLLLDDTVFTGNEIEKHKDLLISKFQVLEENIRSATLVVHENSGFYPDHTATKERLANPKYVAWKEILGSMVMGDIRPTERDHPLYFFEAKNLQFGNFLDVLEEYGELHSVGNWNSELLKLSITIDSSNIKRYFGFKGIEVGSAYKVRLYIKKNNQDFIFTVVPMGFPEIDSERLIQSGDSRNLATLLGLDQTFFENIYENYHKDFRDYAMFYFASRSISAFLLQMLLSKTISRITCNDGYLKLVDPIEVDKAINYIFPDEYLVFYSVVFNKLSEIIKNASRETKNFTLPLLDVWTKPKKVTAQLDLDPFLPPPYKLLGFLASERNMAKWDGRKWIPDYANLDFGVSFKDFLSRFEDPLYISRSLDYLLESGLLRAKDLPDLENNSIYTRYFLAGGEYNAIHVSRISDLLKYEPLFEYDYEAAKDESIEFWGSD